MKKIIYLLFIFILGINITNAKPVAPALAKTIAENFYKQNSKTGVNSVVLAYTELSATGLPVFYVFNINQNDGFVIVTAEDAVKPILGYSTKNQFVAAATSSTIGHWLKYRANEISGIRTQNISADAKTSKEWEKYMTSSTSNLKLNGAASVMSTTVAALVQSTWNQSPYYNDSCPGKSVTGCVATAMGQIMRYWNYPAKGTGSSSYNEEKSTGDYENYGVLSANYGATSYNWANMPLSISSHNSTIAQLMIQCGVSVRMDYSPTESGAWVLSGDNPVCAQHSYITYFGYDPNIIKGYYRSNYDDSTWLSIIEADLNIGRPLQYVGSDPTQGGHTWVCDGYDQNNYLHMNWGWGGSDDGYFSINNLQTTNGGFNPSNNHEVLTGIVPKATSSLDIGIPSIKDPVGFYCATSSLSPIIKLQNFGSTALTSCTINYQIDNGSVQTQNWTGSLVTGQSTSVTLSAFTSTAGSHTLVCYSSNPNNSTDQNATNDQSTTAFNVTSNGGVLPIVEGFETTAALPSSNWIVSHTSSTGIDWNVTSNAAASGSKSIMIDNSANTAGNNSIFQTSSSYDLSTYITPALSFKVAYQQKSTSNNDKIQVYVSTDCGNSWASKMTRSGAALSTVSGTSSSFTPTSANFTTYTVNISSVATSQNVLFRWEFYADPNGPGNNLYLDDINLFDAGAAGIKNIETTVNLNLYPNPSANQVNIGFSLSEKHIIAVNVTDMLGRTVETIDSKSYQTGESVLTIGSKGAYQSGIYLVNIDIDGQHITKKVIIQ